MTRRVTRPTKKNHILSLYEAGAKSIGEIAALANARPSYVAQVLRKEKGMRGYFDLYTSTDYAMNIHSGLFTNRLGFRTESIARRSVQYIDLLYRQFLQSGDHAGQHHALTMALTMMNRALWSKKFKESHLFRAWIMRQLTNMENEFPESTQAHHPAVLERAKS